MVLQDQLFDEKERSKFLGKLIQMFIVQSMFQMTRQSYGVELSGGRITPLTDKAVIPPDVVSSSTDQLIADLARRNLLNNQLSLLLKNFPLHMPKGTNVGFREQTENDSVLYTIRMERPGFFQFDLSVRPSGNTAKGVLPAQFQTGAAKTVKAYSLIVATDSVIEMRNDDGFEPDKYVTWVQDTFAEIRRRMTS